jgi:hypothetical protein
VETSAATICLVAPRSEDERERESIHHDLGQATMSIMLTAADLGIGSGHAYPADPPLAPVARPARALPLGGPPRPLVA